MSVDAACSRIVIVFAASAFGLISCGGTQRGALREVSASPRVATAIVASARMNASESAGARETVRSCAGPSLCREDVLVTADPDAIAEVEEACARLGGTFALSRCPRTEAAATCSGGTEHGTLTVFAYARRVDSADVLARVESQCEALEGTFEALRADSR